MAPETSNEDDQEDDHKELAINLQTAMEKACVR